MRPCLCVAAATLLTASIASAQTAASPPAGVAQPGTVAAAAPTQPKADADKPVCRSSVPTGSRLPVRECHTQAQWDQMAADAKQMTQDSQRNYTPH
jgi:hypothetical protein